MADLNKTTKTPLIPQDYLLKGVIQTQHAGLIALNNSLTPMDFKFCDAIYSSKEIDQCLTENDSAKKLIILTKVKKVIGVDINGYIRELNKSEAIYGYKLLNYFQEREEFYTKEFSSIKSS